MASAKAMARIDCTMIFVDAPGFRPTAMDAAVPIRPTLIAAPNAARATWILPVIRLSIHSDVGSGPSFWCGFRLQPELALLFLMWVPASAGTNELAHVACPS